MRVETWESFAVLSPKLCSHVLRSAAAQAVLTWPPTAPARGRTAAALNLQTQHKGEAGASPSRKLRGFFRLWYDVSTCELAPESIKWESKPRCAAGEEMQKQTLWVHCLPLLFLWCCTLQIEAFILVLISFQRKQNINKIATQVRFKCPWRHHYCCCVWKPHCCQRTPAQRDWETQCFTGGTKQSGNRWWKENLLSRLFHLLQYPLLQLMQYFLNAWTLMQF